MKIKRILHALAFALMTSAASAQEMPAGGGRPALDPATLTEQQIAQVQVPQALFKLAEIYKRSGDAQRLIWSLQRLSVLRPDTGDLKLALAMAYAGLGEKSKTYDLLLSMQKQGFGYDLSKNENFAKVADTRVWTYIVDNLKKNLEPFGQGKVAF
ncbi:MAG TPA: tetratricopeptide repeat protein, partial [Dokdonella sp.]